MSQAIAVLVEEQEGVQSEVAKFLPAVTLDGWQQEMTRSLLVLSTYLSEDETLVLFSAGYGVVKRTTGQVVKDFDDLSSLVWWLTSGRPRTSF